MEYLQQEFTASCRVYHLPYVRLGTTRPKEMLAKFHFASDAFILTVYENQLTEGSIIGGIVLHRVPTCSRHHLDERLFCWLNDEDTHHPSTAWHGIITACSRDRT